MASLPSLLSRLSGSGGGHMQNRDTARMPCLLETADPAFSCFLIVIIILILVLADWPQKSRTTGIKITIRRRSTP